MKELEEKILNIFKKDQHASLATVTLEGKPWVRYVTLIAKPKFPLVFITDTRSRKAQQIRNNAEVHLTCGNLEPPDDSVYLQIQGRATISTDQEFNRTFWNEELIRYFKGPDDPNYVTVKVEPYRIELYGPGSFEPQVWEQSS